MHLQLVWKCQEVFNVHDYVKRCVVVKRGSGKWVSAFSVVQHRSKLADPFLDPSCLVTAVGARTTIPVCGCARLY